MVGISLSSIWLMVWEDPKASRSHHVKPEQSHPRSDRTERWNPESSQAWSHPYLLDLWLCEPMNFFPVLSVWLIQLPTMCQALCQAFTDTPYLIFMAILWRMSYIVPISQAANGAQRVRSFTQGPQPVCGTAVISFHSLQFLVQSVTHALVSVLVG